MATTYYYGTGRRKSATARVYLRSGTGQFIVNDLAMEKYLPRKTDQMIVCQPQVVTDLMDQFDIKVRVRGGGSSGQAGAIRLGVARALLQYDENLRPALREAGFLTRDARKTERKTPGLRKARKRPQYSKR